MSLTERVRMLGGTLRVNATQPGGTTIDVSLPTGGQDAT